MRNIETGENAESNRKYLKNYLANVFQIFKGHKKSRNDRDLYSCYDEKFWENKEFTGFNTEK